MEDNHQNIQENADENDDSSDSGKLIIIETLFSETSHDSANKELLLDGCYVLQLAKCCLVQALWFIQKFGRVMSRDVPICNLLAICREVLNRENREVLHLGKCYWCFI